MTHLELRDGYYGPLAISPAEQLSAVDDLQKPMIQFNRSLARIVSMESDPMHPLPSGRTWRSLGHQRMVFSQSDNYEQRPPLWARYSMELLGAVHEVAPEGESDAGLRLDTSRGAIHCLLNTPASSNGLGVLWAPGSSGGFRGPANGLYAVLARELTEEGVTSLRLDYRHKGNLDESTLDALACVWHLESIGCERIAAVGHSFGGGVVLSAARYASRVRSVAALASQTNGAEDAVLLAGRPLLLVHGEADGVLPVSNAYQIEKWANGPTRLVTYPGAGHGLHECAAELRTLLTRWLLKS